MNNEALSRESSPTGFVGARFGHTDHHRAHFLVEGIWVIGSTSQKEQAPLRPMQPVAMRSSPSTRCAIALSAQRWNRSPLWSRSPASHIGVGPSPLH